MSFARSNRTYVYAETWRLPNLFADLQTEQPFSKRDLLNSLHIYSAARCHEPRDIVYSLLSIGKFEPGAGANFGVNYSTTPKAVYKTLAKQYISCGRALEVVLLASCRGSRSGEKKAELPSWVPNWRLPVRYDSERHKRAVESRLQKNYHGGTLSRSLSKNQRRPSQGLDRASLAPAPLCKRLLDACLLTDGRRGQSLWRPLCDMSAARNNVVH